jgi:hypothetical protein
MDVTRLWGTSVLLSRLERAPWSAFTSGSRGLSDPDGRATWSNGIRSVAAPCFVYFVPHLGHESEHDARLSPPSRSSAQRRFVTRDSRRTRRSGSPGEHQDEEQIDAWSRTGLSGRQRFAQPEPRAPQADSVPPWLSRQGALRRRLACCRERDEFGIDRCLGTSVQRGSGVRA